MSEQISTSWHKYPSTHAIGHREVLDIFEDDVIVEEKVDGSQFSWGVFDGELRCRSRGAVLNIFAPEKMFTEAVGVCQRLHAEGKLTEGWTYRAEYLKSPKHNTLPYDRIPNNHLIGFDINTGHESYLSYEDKKSEFQKLGLETVPLVFQGRVDSPEMFREFLNTISILGGQKIEGVMVKNYNKFTSEKKVMVGKFVSEAFKEMHQGDWKERHPGKKDIVSILVSKYKTPGRWAKAVQHLREAGELEDDPRDIPKVLREINLDVLKDSEADIKEELFKWTWKNVIRGITNGFPEWYKEELMKRSFEQKEAA